MLRELSESPTIKEQFNLARMHYIKYNLIVSACASFDMDF